MTNSLENRVQEHFDQNIHEYSYKNIGAYLQISADRLTTLEALFSHEQPLNILDIGCGAGTFSDLISPGSQMHQCTHSITALACC